MKTVTLILPDYYDEAITVTAVGQRKIDKNRTVVNIHTATERVENGQIIDLKETLSARRMLMTAKEYLSRYHLINIRINQKIDQQRQLRELATNISPSSGGGHSSGVSDKVGMAVAKIATLEQEINAEIDELIRVKAEIEHTISAVADERLRLILIARYINCKTFEYIACEMHYSYKQICRLHGKALLRVQDVLECPIASVV